MGKSWKRKAEKLAHEKWKLRFNEDMKSFLRWESVQKTRTDDKTEEKPIGSSEMLLYNYSIPTTIFSGLLWIQIRTAKFYGFTFYRRLSMWTHTVHYVISSLTLQKKSKLVYTMNIYHYSTLHNIYIGLHIGWNS